MEYILSEQELKDLMHRSWLKAKKFYTGKIDEYFYEHFESEKKQLTIHSVVKSLCDHHWVDAKNIAVESGQMCVKCHNVKA